jgi:hypothetical protein
MPRDSAWETRFVYPASEIPKVTPIESDAVVGFTRNDVAVAEAVPAVSGVAASPA